MHISYDRPPDMEITLEEFEIFAIARLKGMNNSSYPLALNPDLLTSGATSPHTHPLTIRALHLPRSATTSHPSQDEGTPTAFIQHGSKHAPRRGTSS